MVDDRMIDFNSCTAPDIKTTVTQLVCLTGDIYWDFILSVEHSQRDDIIQLYIDLPRIDFKKLLILKKCAHYSHKKIRLIKFPKNET